MSLKRLWLLPLILLSLAAFACGGGGGGSGGGSDEQQAGAAARQSMVTLLGLFTGSSSGKDLLGIFAPECRSGVNASDIDATLKLFRAFAPNLSKDKIDDLDLGKLSYNTTSDGIEVTAVDPSAARVKVKGKWATIDDYFKSAGFGDSTTSNDINEPLLMVKRDGKWYIGDCSALSDLSSP